MKAHIPRGPPQQLEEETEKEANIILEGCEDYYVLSEGLLTFIFFFVVVSISQTHTHTHLGTHTSCKKL